MRGPLLQLKSIYHIFADDTQLYVSFEADGDVDLVKTRIENCIAEVRRWILFNGLKINDDKTTSILMHSKFRPRPSFEQIKVTEYFQTVNLIRTA